MAQNNSCRKRPNILITGTPDTRKTTTTATLAVVTELRHINVGDFANEENLTNDWDNTFDCYYINEDLLQREQSLSAPIRFRKQGFLQIELVNYQFYQSFYVQTNQYFLKDCNAIMNGVFHM
ncbi:uncharacterized protein [Solanum tuberosum]|uniref:uncharacterized protein n=1 Tax=Solanum tuberosum TaxID=4113 RepID=UPI00073A4253|nr:PREDICTED: uncharacterized protein LOC107062392 [Solanum tuberosum]